ncbi:MAG: S41 family peptidase [Myxococcales bacterium]|nr:S41 family peptidase [Polyangiaceae bacterium]MDW8248595.1 S41 family peptidase [Myxococcales bacterium]
MYRTSPHHTQFSSDRPQGKHRSRTLLLGALALASVSFMGGVFFAGTARARPGDQSPYAIVEQMARVLTLVENEYVDPVERDRLLTGAIKGMVAELDPHSAYLPPEENAIFQSETEGKFAGVGVEVELRDEQVLVVAPIEGGPAERAGVRSGDRILAIEGESIRGLSLDRLVKKMRGEPGTKVRLSLLGPADTHPREVTLTREIIRVASVVGRRLVGDIAYLRIKQFQSTTSTEFLRTLAHLRSLSSRPLTGVLLDLRSNPGGLVDQATAIADEFLDHGVIYATRHRGKVVEEVSASRGGSLITLPVVVLVNEFSASASELVAGALQDHQRATIVGAPTFGKGSVQTILDLGGGNGMKLTTQRYTTPRGRILQATGITPDLLVEAPLGPPGTRIFREKDLENHLPPQDHETSSHPPRAPTSSLPSSPPDSGMSRDVPEDPTQSKDRALQVGYQALLAKIKK